MSESVRLTVNTITRPFLFQNTGCLNYSSGEDGLVQPTPKVQVTSQGTIPPVFTLGNQCIYWDSLRSVVWGLLSGVWVLPLKRPHQDIFTQQG